MEKNYRFTLDPGSEKFECPECGQKRFVRYIDNETQEYIPEQYGKCDRSGHYHLNPYSDGYAKSLRKPLNTMYKSRSYFATNKSSKDQPKIYVPLEVLKETLKDHSQNNFFNNLQKNVPFPFQLYDIQKIIDEYLIGTINPLKRRDQYLKGAVTFPYFENIEQIQAIQIVQYDANNHRKFINWIDTYLSPKPGIDMPADFPAVKSKRNTIEWIELRRDQKKVNCYFGAHLVKKYPHNPIVLVESPKSALIGMLYFGFPDDHPDNPIWLATGSKDTFSMDRSRILSKRLVIIFPDLSLDGATYREWVQKASEYQSNLPWTSFKVSSYFEETASFKEKSNGLDVADYLITRDWRIFRDRHKVINEVSGEEEKIKQALATPKKYENTFDDPIWDQIQKITIDDDFFSVDNRMKLSRVKEDWSKEFEEIDAFFSTTHLPTFPIQLNAVTKLHSINGFLEANLEVAKAQNGNPTYRPYLNRVIELMRYLKENK